MILLMYGCCEPLVCLLEKNLVKPIVVIVEIVEVYVAYVSRGFYPFHLGLFHVKIVVSLWLIYCCLNGFVVALIVC